MSITNTKHLSEAAMRVIGQYLNLPLGENVPCPYFNNRKIKVRAGLKALIGKGSPKDIVEEAEITAIKEKIDLKKLSEKELKKFLVEHGIGIDCSGFAYHVLNAETKGDLKKNINFPYLKNPIRKLLAKFRAAENINVKTLAHESNSTVVDLKSARPGDIIIILKNTKFGDINHILVIHQVDYRDGMPAALHYTHSYQWNIDGKYGHGVRQGKIEIININKKLIDQRWIEKAKEGKENQTFQNAASARGVEMRRLKELS